MAEAKAAANPEGQEPGTRRGRVWNVPNTFTMSRLLLSAVVFAAIEFHWYRLALVVFTVAALTDFLDGYLARLFAQSSALGRQLDPLVDKVIVVGSLIYLLPVSESGLAPWSVTMIVVRELVVQAIRSLVEGRGIAFGAKMAGKLKTTFQFVSIVAILLLLGWELPPALVYVRDILIWLSVILTVYSGLVYVAAAWPLLQAESSPEK